MSPLEDVTMVHLPPRFSALILAFAPLFLSRSWRHAKVMLSGAILAPGRRTVTSILRIIPTAVAPDSEGIPSSSVT